VLPASRFPTFGFSDEVGAAGLAPAKIHKVVDALIAQQKKWTFQMPGRRRFRTSFTYTVYIVYKP
jgi:hypothetical protein